MKLNEKEVKIKYDKDFFNKWIQSKIIKSNVGYIKIDTFLDFGLDGVYNPKVLERLVKYLDDDSSYFIYGPYKNEIIERIKCFMNYHL